MNILRLRNIKFFLIGLLKRICFKTINNCIIFILFFLANFISNNTTGLNIIFFNILAFIFFLVLLIFNFYLHFNLLINHILAQLYFFF